MIGTKLAHYEITSHLGTGGMGEVYQATDSKLGRSVAIKLLPAAFANDVERAARFEREARVLASLNHPNIAAIYGVEESGGRKFLVMELIDGETLADKIKRGAIPVPEALGIAIQITEALEAAHEKGIIHRDLKPANIKVTPDGRVKVLDFGLAKAFAGDTEVTDSSNSPTMTSMAATNAGVILGTAAYMSPEQAKGRNVGKRSDIFGFGCVLFEMLTGRAAFEGEDIADILSRVLQREPDWSLLPAVVPSRIRELLQLCLHKDMRKRRSSAADVRIDIEQALAAPVADSSAAPARRSLTAWAAFAVAVLAAVALAIPALHHLRETLPPEARHDIVTPASSELTSFALSPDGQQIAFVASGGGASRLWLRSLSSTTAQPLAGTEGAHSPFWSPNSQSIGFFANGSLKRLDLGGTPQTLAPAVAGQGGTWNADGIIVFAPSLTTPLMRVPATGGTPAAVTMLDPTAQGHVQPHFLPDGHRFLFYVQGGQDVRGIYLGELEGKTAPRRVVSASGGRYLPSGWMLWVRDGTHTLLAQRLDVAKAVLTGEPVTVADGILVDERLLQSSISVSATGLIAYRMGATNQRQLSWFDRMGKAQGTVGDPDDTLYQPRVSPDGRRIVVARTVEGNRDIWLFDGTRTNRVTFDAAQEYFPVWASDSMRIIFRSNRAKQGEIYLKRIGDARPEELVVDADQLITPCSWSADGRYLMFMKTDPQTSTDLWIAPIGEASGTGRVPWVFLKTPFREAYGAFSPDGRWVAYQSNISGRPEIYVKPFVRPDVSNKSAPAAEGQWQVSTLGGVYPVWRHDSKELYFINPAGAVMAASISVSGSNLDSGTPMMLFPTHMVGVGTDLQQGPQYDVSIDGRFLINTELESAAAPITLLQHWHPPAK